MSTNVAHTRRRRIGEHRHKTEKTGVLVWWSNLGGEAGVSLGCVAQPRRHFGLAVPATSCAARGGFTLNEDSQCPANRRREPAPMKAVHYWNRLSRGRLAQI